MTDNYNQVSSSSSTNTATPSACSVCHQPILPQNYFCPNCGTKLDSAPLSTSVLSQIGIYLHSIILPMIVFISISKWRGLKYSKSSDPKTRMIGIVAWVLLILSTIFLFWLTWYETIKLQEAFQTSMDQMNKDLKSMGF
jgi:hypothetical protein